MSNSIDNCYRLVGGHRSYSQAYQDLFVRAMLDFKVDGTYVEIGASDPRVANNSFVLEDEYRWKGVSFDIDREIVDSFNDVRKNPCLLADASQYDYIKYFHENKYPKQIDYLSLDIDPAEVTYQTLLKLPLDEYRFSVITYEHDRYTAGSNIMSDSRKYLKNHGYQLVVANVLTRGRDFEDWYVDPIVIKNKIFEPYISSNIEASEIFTYKFS